MDRTTALRSFKTLLLVTTFSISGLANALQEEEYLDRVRTPAVVRSTIGGESHHSYVVRARAGQRMTVRISWRPDREWPENHAEFYVSELPTFGGDGLVKFGKETHNGKSWTGRIPKTKDYYIYVMAHPIADYTLRVTVR